VKKNLDNLKKCQFNVVNLLVRTEPNRLNLFIPKVILTPIVTVTNPNEEDVEIYKFNLNIALMTSKGEQPIGKVTNEDPIRIPKNSTIEFPLALDIDQSKGIDTKFISLVLQLVSAAAKGEEAEIVVQGDLQIHSSFGTIPLPVYEKQTIKLLK
jgi:hypothetical protein